MGNIEDKKEDVFKLIQHLLKDVPVIIWGSGAVIDYGLPSMANLKQNLKGIVKGLDNDEANLEKELGKIDDENKLNNIIKIIRGAVLEKDLECLENAIQDSNYFEAVTKMLNIFYNPHPCTIDIITTNYDRVLEYALSQSGYSYTDGFSGRLLSEFKPKAFEKNKEMIHLIKVHGSLNWVEYDNRQFFLSNMENIENVKPVMILPSNNKYKDAYMEPFRSLIIKSDSIIENAKSFLIVGFGFNDEHLIPKIEKKIKEGTPTVVITKQATTPCKDNLRNATNYCLLEQSKSENKTKITLRKNKSDKVKELDLEGNYWQLNKFMEIYNE